MTSPVETSIHHLEFKLSQQKDPLQRMLLIDQLTGQYAFTQVERARELLLEQKELLDQYNYPDFRLNYLLRTAIIENQLYNFNAAEASFLQAIDMLEERGTVKDMAEVYIDYMGTCMNMEQMDQATELQEKTERLLKKFPDERLRARMICREGFLNLHYGNYSKAIELFLEAEKIINSLETPLSLKDLYFMTLVHSGLGKVYEKDDEHEKSVRAYLKVVKMCESIPMRTRLSWHYLNVGIGYMAIEDPDNAEQYFRKAINVDDDISQHARASAYGNLGYCYMEKDRFEEALELFERAEHVYKEISEEDFYNFSVIENWRARIFAESKQLDEALEHFALAYEYASKIEDYKQLSSVCKDIAAFYVDLDDYKSAFEYQNMHVKFAERYTEQINKRRQMELEVKYEAAKKRQETELLKLQATRLQLKALRAQMNPHFMYNALNSIQNYITSNKGNSAAKYLAKFAKLMRQSLDYSDLEIISLEKELEFLEDYLYINEKLRFEDRLSFEIKVDDEIEEDILGVPTMIVQPYVENAIEHGLRSKKNGLIQVRFSLLEEDTILCVVEDNGIGREKARQLQEKDAAYKNHRSKGTKITEKRLQILHHSKNKGVLVKTIDLVDEETGEARGTRVEIKIPIVEIQIK